jgi:actin-related protein 2
MTGGTTMFPGLSTRMYKELAGIMTERKYKGDATRVSKTGLTVHDPPRRKNAVFIGGSFLANNAPDQQWISKADW